MILDIPEATIDWRAKGFWQPEGEVSVRDFVAAKHTLFDGSFTWPLLVVRDSAVRANIATMAEYARRHGFSFAPHAKTSMAPSLLEAQLAAGAWAQTAATANQALVLRRLGVPRVLIANEVLDPTALRWLAAESRKGWEVLVQVDSVPAAEAAGDLPVLIEVGHRGGRTGCRTVADVVSVARAARNPVGVTAYEGALRTAEEVDAFLALQVEAVHAIADRLPAEVIVSAGGSAWFDRVVAALEGQWLPGHTVRAVLRSGASVTHDEGFYRERTPFNRVAEGSLTAGLELHAQVLSTPEPGLAIVGMGKRDAPFDEGLPVTAAGEVVRLNDHHTYVRTDSLAVGDLVRFGLSHPCTAFDKWRYIPVADDADVVVDVLHTYF
ncbi:alanine racemase [Actinoplanes sp. RD1]|uniref:alanine racemase n=1 Tax=Actinoplanes sp. RD1 TaxID=3064538 RepID=UPI002742098C|nr:alanine racemase [Actinoplanes sp. RD1]